MGVEPNSGAETCGRPQLKANAVAIANAPTDIAALLDWQDKAKALLEQIDSWYPVTEEVKQLLEEM